MTIASNILSGIEEGNDRSKFLSALMKSLSGEPGKAVISSYVSKDTEKFKSAVGKIVDKLVQDTLAK